MPDGDRLYWKVQGKGSRRVLNLLQRGLDDKLVADSVIRMFVEQVNHGGWKPVLREIAGVLVEALRESPSNGKGVERTDRFFQLTHQVEAVVSNHGDRALAPIDSSCAARVSVTRGQRHCAEWESWPAKNALNQKVA
jgi:hypothetical protein